MSKFKTFIRRQVWREEGVAHNPFMLFFVVQNFFLGVLFALGPFIPDIGSLTLFTGLDSLLPAAAVAPVWGAILVGLVILHTIKMYTGTHEWGQPIGMAAIVLWTYALVVYLLQPTIWAVLAIVAPQMFFWAWYYISCRMYERDLDTGRVHPVE